MCGLDRGPGISQPGAACFESSSPVPESMLSWSFFLLSPLLPRVPCFVSPTTGAKLICLNRSASCRTTARILKVPPINQPTAASRPQDIREGGKGKEETARHGEAEEVLRWMSQTQSECSLSHQAHYSGVLPSCPPKLISPCKLPPCCCLRVWPRTSRPPPSHVCLLTLCSC